MWMCDKVHFIEQLSMKHESCYTSRETIVPQLTLREA